MFKHKFQLKEDIKYINCAYMAPLLKSSEELGIEGLKRKRNPFEISALDFFTDVEKVRVKFSELVNCTSSQVALMPSVSYGFASVFKNLKYKKGQHGIVVSDEFPSGYFSASAWCKENNAELKTIQAPDLLFGKGKIWNENLLEAINKNTAFVLISSVHWMDGTKFDLETLGNKCKEVGAKFLIDGTQSVGALKMDVQKFKIDALICAGYKWLLGPYSQVLAFINESFNEGSPLEESWMNRTNAHDFSKLATYENTYFSDASRYNVGETSDFAKIPMIDESLRQILEWKVETIQGHCKELVSPLIDFLKENEISVEDEKYRTNHLLGFKLPKHIKATNLLEDLQKEKIYLSLRGESLRISPNVYNTKEDIDVLIETLKINIHNS
ncbi:MAG: aminotransferase class V-fold PLP-dependent enzyme [Bacteroidota bacterium]